MVKTFNISGWIGTGAVTWASSFFATPFGGISRRGGTSCSWESMFAPVIQTPGTFSALGARRANAGAAGDLLSIRKDFVDTLLQVTTTAHDQFQEDSINSVHFDAGEVITYGHTSGCTYRAMRYLFEPDAPVSQMCLYGIGTYNGGVITAPGPVFLPLCGNMTNWVGNLTEEQAQLRTKLGGTIRNVMVLVVFRSDCIPAPTTNHNPAVTIRSRINGAYGNLIVTVPAGAVDAFFDLSNTDVVNVDDLFCWEVGGFTSGRICVVFITAEFVHTLANGDHEVFLKGPPGGTIFAANAASADIVPPGGEPDFGSTENVRAVSLGMPGGLKNFRVKVRANSATEAQTFAMFVDGVQTSLAVSFNPGETGEKLSAVQIPLTATQMFSIGRVATPTSTGTIAVDNFAYMIPAAAGPALAGRRWLSESGPVRSLV